MSSNPPLRPLPLSAGRPPDPPPRHETILPDEEPAALEALDAALEDGGVAGLREVAGRWPALLDGWGGLRRSEGLHLWLNDVVPDPERAGHALVVLNHPAEAKVQDTLSARRSMIARKNLLARDYGLEPRNEVTRGSAQPSCLAPPRRISFSEVFGECAAAGLFDGAA